MYCVCDKGSRLYVLGLYSPLPRDQVCYSFVTREGYRATVVGCVRAIEPPLSFLGQDCFRTSLGFVGTNFVIRSFCLSFRKTFHQGSAVSISDNIPAACVASEKRSMTTSFTRSRTTDQWQQHSQGAERQRLQARIFKQGICRRHRFVLKFRNHIH